MKIKQIKLHNLNAEGITHLLIPFVIIMLVASVGTYMLVASKAAVNGGGYNGADAICYSSTYPVSQRASCVAGVAKMERDRRAAKARNADSGNTAISSIPANPISNDPPTVASPIISKIAAPPAAPPSGNILVVTYVNDPAIERAGGKDHRLGLVRVKVERTGGPNNCDSRKSQTAKTNAKQELTRKDGTKILVKGTVNFLGCDTGNYTITLLGRKGYTAAGPKVKQITLSNDEHQKVSFVLNKK